MWERNGDHAIPGRSVIAVPDIEFGIFEKAAQFDVLKTIIAGAFEPRLDTLQFHLHLERMAVGEKLTG